MAGAIEAVYTGLMGDLFFGVVLLGLGAVTWIRTNDAAYVAVLWIASGASLWALLPSEARLLGSLFLILGASVAVWRAWFGRQA